MRPRLDGGVPAVNGFTPDARRAVDGWAGACAVTWRSGGRKRGGFWAAEASNYGHSPPTPVSGDPDFKKRVALEALRGDRTVQAIAAKHEVHPNQVGTWKRQAVEGLDEVFARGGSPGPSEHEATIRDLHAKVGELTMERDFFQRGLQR